MGTRSNGTEDHDKVKENRLRRMAKRRGLALMKSRRRDPRAYDYGGFMLIEPNRNIVIFGANPNAFSADLNDIEAFLDR